MKNPRAFRYGLIALVLLLGVSWALNEADNDPSTYPNSELLATVPWLANNLDQVVVVDVREDKYFDGDAIKGAIRLPWKSFRHNDSVSRVAGRFVGVDEAQKILGRHGITRTDSIVLYDSVARDGGATASYVFWILDVLGHKNVRILDGGIDAWKTAGHETGTVQKPKALTYQAAIDELNPDSLVRGDFVYSRLGDVHYQILDVRSRDEYLGKKGTKGLSGEPLKLGHIPTAYNVNHESAWRNAESKRIKSYSELQQLYRGLNSEKAVIVYCNSGRRSSHSYFILRLMGFADVRTYEASWKEWGDPAKFYPVETQERSLTSGELPQASHSPRKRSSSGASKAGSGGDKKPKGGYVSCGG